MRFDKLTTAEYVWPWKGGVPEGAATADKYRFFPLPTADVNANPNLVPTIGY